MAVVVVVGTTTVVVVGNTTGWVGGGDVVGVLGRAAGTGLRSVVVVAGGSVVDGGSVGGATRPESGPSAAL
jgi:hypothetical protein